MITCGKNDFPTGSSVQRFTKATSSQVFTTLVGDLLPQYPDIPVLTKSRVNFHIPFRGRSKSYSYTGDPTEMQPLYQTALAYEFVRNFIAGDATGYNPRLGAQQLVTGVFAPQDLSPLRRELPGAMFQPAIILLAFGVPLMWPTVQLHPSVLMATARSAINYQISFEDALGAT